MNSSGKSDLHLLKPIILEIFLDFLYLRSHLMARLKLHESDLSSSPRTICRTDDFFCSMLPFTYIVKLHKILRHNTPSALYPRVIVKGSAKLSSACFEMRIPLYLTSVFVDETSR